MFVEFILNVLDIASKNTGNVKFKILDLEFFFSPVLLDISSQRILKFELFVSLISDIFHVVTMLSQLSIQQICKDKLFRSVRDFLSCDLINFVPMSSSDRWFRKSFNEWENFSHCVDFIFQVFVGLPRLQAARETGTIFAECFDLFFHSLDLVGDFEPWDIFPFAYCVFDFLVQRIQLIQKFNLIFSVNKIRVVLMRKSEQSFSCEV